MNKISNKKINQKLSNLTSNNFLLIVFVILVLLNFLVILKNYWTIFLLCFLLAFLIVKKINKYQIVFGIVCIVWYLLLILFVSSKINSSWIVKWLDKNINLFYIRNQTIKYFEQIYHNQVALSIIKLFIFNIKTTKIDEMLMNTKQLDVLYLFTVSGVHINLLLWIVKKILSKNKIISEIAEWILILLIGYFLGFSIPSLRILSTKIFKYNFKSKEATAMSGILNSLLFINISRNYGFILSYGCTLCIECVLKLKTKKYLELILINIICSLFSCFILIVMNNKFNPMSIIYNFCLSPFILVWYLWIQFSFLIPFLENIQECIFNGYYWIITLFSNLNFNIEIHSNTKQLFILCYYPFIWLWIKN